MIEVVSEQNFEEVLPLIRQYQEFYKVADICDDRNREFFSQFGETNPEGCQFLFRDGDQVLGFATVYFTYSSTIAAKTATMNDLFTISEARGKGVGRQLIEHCREFAKTKGAVRLQWMTAEDNQTAMRLYDSLDTKNSNWKFYTYQV